MNERETDEEREALRAAQAELNRSESRRLQVKVWTLAMGAVLALSLAAFVGWYLGSR